MAENLHPAFDKIHGRGAVRAAGPEDWRGRDTSIRNPIDLFNLIVQALSGGHPNVTQAAMPDTPSGKFLGHDRVSQKAIEGLSTKFPKVIRAVERQIPGRIEVEAQSSWGPGETVKHAWADLENEAPWKFVTLPASPQKGVVQTPESGLLHTILSMLYRTRRGGVPPTYPPGWNEPLNYIDSPVMKLQRELAPWSDQFRSATHGEYVPVIDDITAGLAERMLASHGRPKPKTSHWGRSQPDDEFNGPAFGPLWPETKDSSGPYRRPPQ